MAAITFPQEVKDGSCIVTIYETPTKGYPSYTLAYYMDGKRKRETCADYDAIRLRADEVLRDIKEGRTDPTALKAGERADYIKAVEIVKPTGQTLQTAASHYAEAFKILGADLVIAAAREYASRHHDKLKPCAVSKAVDEMIAEKQRSNKSKRHVDTLASHLKRFSKFSLGASPLQAVISFCPAAICRL